MQRRVADGKRDLAAVPGGRLTRPLQQCFAEGVPILPPPVSFPIPTAALKISAPVSRAFISPATERSAILRRRHLQLQAGVTLSRPAT
jgi:hypothetical protein